MHLGRRFHPQNFDEGILHVAFLDLRKVFGDTKVFEISVGVHQGSDLSSRVLVVLVQYSAAAVRCAQS